MKRIFIWQGGCSG